MSHSWTENGPVSLPPRWLAYTAGAVVLALAIVGVGVGVRAAFRDGGAPDLGGVTDSAADKSTLVAAPIVQPPPPVAAPDASADADKDDSADADKDKADALATKAAMAQEIQAKPSKPGGDIDDILTSPSEKPPAPAKAGADEAPPSSAPVKTDVPF
jgi:hypothetical protein